MGEWTAVESLARAMGTNVVSTHRLWEVGELWHGRRVPPEVAVGDAVLWWGLGPLAVEARLAAVAHVNGPLT